MHAEVGLEISVAHQFHHHEGGLAFRHHPQQLHHVVAGKRSEIRRMIGVVGYEGEGKLCRGATWVMNGV
jgi:hypothetical protein